MASDEVVFRAMDQVTAEVRALGDNATAAQWAAADVRVRALARYVASQGGHLELEGFDRARRMNGPQ